MATIEVKNDYMLGRQNENILYYKCMELEQENKQLKEKIDDLESLIELLYYKIELNNEQQKLLDQILGDKE